MRGDGQDDQALEHQTADPAEHHEEQTPVAGREEESAPAVGLRAGLSSVKADPMAILDVRAT